MQVRNENNQHPGKDIEFNVMCNQSVNIRTQLGEAEPYISHTN